MTNQDHFNQFVLLSAQYLGVSPEYLLDMYGESSGQDSDSLGASQGSTGSEPMGPFNS